MGELTFSIIIEILPSIDWFRPRPGPENKHKERQVKNNGKVSKKGKLPITNNYLKISISGIAIAKYFDEQKTKNSGRNRSTLVQLN